MNRKKSCRKSSKKKKMQEFIKRLGTLNIVLICVFAYMIYINWKMLSVFSQCGSAPESAWCALIAALLGECGICGWIRTTKDKKLDRKWQKQDEREAQDVPDTNVGSIIDDGEDNTEEDMEENEDDEH